MFRRFFIVLFWCLFFPTSIRAEVSLDSRKQEINQLTNELKYKTPSSQSTRFQLFGANDTRNTSSAPTTHDLENVARRRKQLLLETLATDPQILIDNQLDPDRANQLNQSFTSDSLIERPMRLTGTINTRIVDGHDHDEVEYIQSLEIQTETNQSRRFFLHNLDTLTPTDTQVSITGLQLDDQIVVTDHSSLPNKSLSIDQATQDKLNIAVLNIKFADNQHFGYTQEELTNKLIRQPDSVRNYYKEASSNQLDIDFELFAPLELPIQEPQTCPITNDLLGVVSQVTAAQHGYRANQFDHVLLFFPIISSCSRYAGWADPYQSPKLAYINGTDNIGTITHEIGHNLGLAHAQRLECPKSSISFTSDPFHECYIHAYGDTTDVMGYSRNHHLFNGPHLDNLNWLSDDQIARVDTSGVYQVSRRQGPPGIPRALVIPLNNHYAYYLTYRQAEGMFDGHLQHIGTQLHLFPKTYYDPDLLLYKYSYWLEYHDQDTQNIHTSLPTNKLYTDPFSQVSIVQTEINADTATLQVDVSDECRLITPQVELLTTVAPDVLREQTTSFEFRLTNRNTGECQPESFIVSPSLYNNSLDGQVDRPTVELANGQTQVLSLSVTANSGPYLRNGQHQVQLYAYNQAAAGYADTATATFNIVGQIPGIELEPASALHRTRGDVVEVRLITPGLSADDSLEYELISYNNLVEIEQLAEPDTFKVRYLESGREYLDARVYREDLSDVSLETFDLVIDDLVYRDTDITRDRKVDLQDYLELAKNFLSNSPSEPRSDITHDGKVDLQDYLELAGDFLTTY